MIGLYPGGIGGTRQQSNFPRARLRRVDRAPRLPRGSRGPGYRVARDVSWGNLRLRALRIYLYLAPGILGSRGVKRKTRKCDTVPFPGSGDVAASRREDGPMRPYG